MPILKKRTFIKKTLNTECTYNLINLLTIWNEQNWQLKLQNQLMLQKQNQKNLKLIFPRNEIGSLFFYS